MSKPQRSKRDRISTKVHDRIALARCEAAVRKAEEDYARHAHWTTISPKGTTYGFDALVIR